MDNSLEDDAITQELQLLRVAAGITNENEEKLSALEKGLIVSILLGLFKALTKKSLSLLIIDVNNQIDDAYKDIYKNVNKAVDHVVIAESKSVVKSVNKVVPTEIKNSVLADKEVRTISDSLLVQGSKVDSWVNKQKDDTAFKVDAIVKSGVVLKEDTTAITNKIKAVIATANRNMDAVVKTTVMTAAAKARLETFSKLKEEAGLSIIGMKQVSVLDNKTSDICIAYSGKEWDLEGNPIHGNDLPFLGGPPRHMNCRSILVPIIAGVNENTASGTVDSFLRSKPKSEIEAILGKGRADLFMSKKITLSQLLDFRGNALSLDELHKLYGK